MDDILYQRIKGHVEAGEKRIRKPYRDSKGLLTAGAGFKVNDAGSFARLPFKVKDTKTGQMRPATDDEKRKEFDRIKGMSQDEIKEDTNAFLLDDPGIDTTLKSEIEDRVGKIKGEIGEADWEKLTDGQKAAVLDIHYARGSLKDFPNLKDAIKSGDARVMAEEAGFHSGGKRNWEREARNQAAILGVSQEEGRRIVQEKFKDQNPKFDDPVAPPKQDLSTLRPEPRPEAHTKGKPEPSPAPQPEPAPEQKQSEAPTPDPAVAGFRAQVAAPIADKGLAALLKPEAHITEGEYKALIDSAATRKAGDPLRHALYDKSWAVAGHVYGEGPQTFDGGQPVEPEAVNPFPEAETPLDLSGMDRVARAVETAAGTDGLPTAVRHLQRGFNLADPAEPLKEDGVYGPKTDLAAKRMVATKGAEAAENAFALGRFNAFARTAQRDGKPDALFQAADAAFAPLLPKGSRVHNEILQETVNRRGAERLDDWTDLKIDGDVGPKTTAAFGRLLEADDSDELTRDLGRGLGLL